MTKSWIFTLLGGALGMVSAMAVTLPLQAQEAQVVHDARAQQQINPFAQELLDEHNAERAVKGASALRWNPQLARDAQEWADHLARTQRFEHASHAVRKQAGENLWMGTAGHFSARDMMSGFLSEKRDFRPGTFPEVSRTGRWQDVGHYTQIIWRDTREVGCALSSSRGNDVLVCRYFPTGNVMGQPIA